MYIRSPFEWLFAQFAEAGEDVGSAPPAKYFPGATAAAPTINKITIADLRLSIRQGLADFAAARTDVIFLCLIYPVAGLFIGAADARGNFLPLLFPAAAGFALVGPLFATGLYEMSRQRELTGSIRWLDVFNVIRSPSILSIAALGLILIGMFLLWLALAQEIYQITLGPASPPSIGAFLTALFTTGAGWAMIILGCAAGGIFAIAVLAISVVSFPLLLDRPVGLATAIGTSLKAVSRNPGPMALWGFIVAAGLVVGCLPAFIGLVVVLPVLGHSTWHLYRRLVAR
jgi:uncharacterized membrane protein